MMSEKSCFKMSTTKNLLPLLSSLTSSTSTSLLSLDYLPDVVILKISELLDFESKINFMKTSQHIYNIVVATFKKYNVVQISDEPFDSYLKVEAKTLSNGTTIPDEKLQINPDYLMTIFEICPNINTIILAVKVLGSKSLTFNTGNDDSSIFESSMYSRSGYIGKLLQEIPPNIYGNLESVCLHIDLSVESFSELAVPCPTEDLKFAVHYLSDKPFQTFIQIAFCATEIAQNDNLTNCMLLAAMHSLAYEMRYYGCKTIIDFGEDEYYCDLTVYKGNLEYSFAFFYYNPQFCEPSTSSVNMSYNSFDMDDIEDEDENQNLNIPINLDKSGDYINHGYDSSIYDTSTDNIDDYLNDSSMSSHYLDISDDVKNYENRIKITNYIFKS